LSTVRSIAEQKVCYNLTVAFPFIVCLYFVLYDVRYLTTTHLSVYGSGYAAAVVRIIYGGLLHYPHG